MARRAQRADSAPLPGRASRGSESGRPIMALLDLAGRRWTLRIVWELSQSGEALSFRALRHRCADMSSSVLARRLQELTEAALVARAGDGRGYELTPVGAELVEEMLPLIAWSERWAGHLAERDQLGDRPAARSGG